MKANTISYDKKVIEVNGMFKLKHNSDASIAKKNTRQCQFLEVFSRDNVYYLRFYAHVTKTNTIRLVIVKQMQRGWSIFYLDFTLTFLNGLIQKLVFVTQLPIFEIKDKEYMIHRLNKELYGLKHIHRDWKKRIYEFLVKLDFNKCMNEYGVYVQETTSNTMMICLYVSCDWKQQI